MIGEYDTITVSNQPGVEFVPLLADQDTTIRAYKITVEKGLRSTAGYGVTLVADTIVFEEDAIIDVSGVDGGPPPPAPATQSGSPSNGAKGASGTNGGSIDIIARHIEGQIRLRSRGGRGGQGQNGEDGYSTTIWKGGNAGPPGDSGNGGDIRIICNDFQDSQLETDLTGGDPAAPAISGASHWTYDHNTPVFDDDGKFLEFAMVLSAPGKPGAAGVQGHNGNVQLRHNVDMQVYSSFASTGQMRHVLATAEANYLNDPDAGASDRLIWLCGLTSDTIRSSENTTAGPSIQEFYNRLPSDYDGLHRRSAILLSQAMNGLSYYGFPNDFMTFYNFQSLQNGITAMAQLASDSESKLDNWLSDFSNLQKQSAAAVASITTVENTKTDLAGKLPTLYQQANTLRGIIDDLKYECDRRQVIVLAYEDRFNEAIQAASGCSLKEIVLVAAAIVAVAAAVYTAGTSIVAAGEAIGAAVEDGIAISAAIQSIQTIVKKVETAIDAVDDVAKKYNDLKKDLNANADSARIQMTQDDLNTVKDKFHAKVDAADVDESLKQEFKDAFDDYLNATNARNHKIAEYDAVAITIAQNLAGQAQLEGLKNQIVAGQFAAADPDKKSLQQLIDSSLAVNRELLRFLVWTEKRALAFWTAADLNASYLSSETRVSEFASVDSIVATHATIIGQFVESQAFGASTSGQFPRDQVINIPITDELRQRLATTKQLSFDIAFDQFDPMYCVLAQNVTVSYEGSSAFYGNLIHTGIHRILLPPASSGTPAVSRTYSTFPLTFGAQQTGASVSIDLTAGAMGVPARVGVSPFTTWILKVNDNSTHSSDIASLSSLKLTFKGFYSAG